MNMSVITSNGRNLLHMMVTGYEYTFNELMKLCCYSDTELCLAVLYLIKEGKVKQYRTHDIYYQVVR